MSQKTSNHGFKEQFVPIPMPNGYGTVTIPHLEGQPFLARLLPLKVVLEDVILCDAAKLVKRNQYMRQKRTIVNAFFSKRCLTILDYPVLSCSILSRKHVEVD